MVSTVTPDAAYYVLSTSDASCGELVMVQEVVVVVGLSG